MYRSIILLICVSFCVGILHAESGLFGLSFGDSREAATLTLGKQGFKLELDLPEQIVMVPLEEEPIKGIEIRFNAQTDSLTGWSIGYSLLEEEDMGELVIGALISWHGPMFEKKDTGIYRWDLGSGQSVSAGWDYFRGMFVVDYRQEASPVKSR